MKVSFTWMAPGKSVLEVHPLPGGKSRVHKGLWKISSFENFHGSNQKGGTENNS